MADMAVLAELAELSSLLQGRAKDLSLRQAELDQREAMLTQTATHLNQQQQLLSQQAEELQARQQTSTLASHQSHLESENKRRQLLILQLRGRCQGLEHELVKAKSEGQAQAVLNRRLKGRLEALQTWKQETLAKVTQLQHYNDALVATMHGLASTEPVSRLDQSHHSTLSTATDNTYVCPSGSSPANLQQSLRLAATALQHLGQRGRARCCQSLCTPTSFKDLCQLQLYLWETNDHDLKRTCLNAFSPVVCETLLKLQSSVTASCRSAIKLLATTCQPVLELSEFQDCASIELIPKLLVLALVAESGKLSDF
jgi:hypothetical protein